VAEAYRFVGVRVAVGRITRVAVGRTTRVGVGAMDIRVAVGRTTRVGVAKGVRVGDAWVTRVGDQRDQRHTQRLLRRPVRPVGRQLRGPGEGCRLYHPGLPLLGRAD